jgi:phytoene synthase
LPAENFAFAHTEALVRDADPDRYWATLFAPADKRPYLFALYAFSHEIARVRESVHEPMIGEIRLQWWRDALQGEARGDVKANPIAAALDDTIVRFRLPRQAFVDLIDARVFDLYDDLFPTVNDLEGYCGETSSSLIRLAALVLADGTSSGSADAAGHVGVAYALTGILRAFPWQARRGQVFIPRDVLSRHGVVREDIVSGRGGPGLTGALSDLRALARKHEDQVRRLRSGIPPSVSAAFRPIALVEPYLARMEKSGYDPFHSAVELQPWLRIWALWRGRL